MAQGNADVAKLPRTRKVFYVPSVDYQLREKGLELIKCNPVGYCMYSTLNVIEGGNGRPQKIRDNLLKLFAMETIM